MPNAPKNRKADQYAWLNRVWTVVVSTIILAALGFAWQMPSIYATAKDMEQLEKDAEITAQRTDDKLDKILDVVQKLDTRTAIQANDMEYIKDAIASESQARKDADVAILKSINGGR